MNYKALYRQWRPQSFVEVVGQEHITKTLMNAINSNCITHAYLFCGPRGTGKTSTARIIGKSVNCVNRQGAEPCNQCELCKRISNGSSMDVQEIDAASNRGIEEIRDLREKVKYAPAEGKYKVYIIDEVHMLTPEAFNALLKTLEEPPGHVIFILATTEPHKLPATILSRCQRFDFRRIGGKEIKERLRLVVDSLGLEIDEEALSLLAKAANGGLRDALSALDQCIAYAENKISVKEVTDVLGTLTQEVVLNITQMILDGDVTSLLRLLNNTLDEGKDPQLLLQDLLEHFRNILLIQICQDPGSLVALPDDVIAKIQKQSLEFNRAQLDYIIDTLTQTEGTMKWSGNPQIMLELGLLKALNYQADLNLEMLANRIAALEAGAAAIQNTSIASKPKNAPTQITANRPKNKVNLQQIKDNWQQVIKGVKKANISTYAFLVEAQVVNLQKGILTLGYQPEYNFHREKLEQKQHRSLVEQILKTAFGQDIKVQCSLLAEGGKNFKDDVLEKAQEIFGHDKIEEENK